VVVVVVAAAAAVVVVKFLFIPFGQFVYMGHVGKVGHPKSMLLELYLFSTP
jgi:hypothetical protein